MKAITKKLFSSCATALTLSVAVATSMITMNDALAARHNEAAPFAYPNRLLDAPATLSTPLGAETFLGKPRVLLEHTTLQALTDLTGAARMRDGRGEFARDIVCMTGTENGKPMIGWFISSDNKTITEVQLEWLGTRTAPAVCKALPSEMLPIRFGKVGLGMLEADVLEALGKPSLSDEDGWRFWFSQRFLRNARNLQELELNWIAVHLDADGRVDKSFTAQVTNL